MNKITSSHFRRNPASGKVMENCEMKKECELNEHRLKNSIYYDLIMCGKIRE
ncbi:GNAT family N-acetyltransferase [Maribacter sp. ACAM166]|uniref:GNAT family N-acetyltransferase n=1 Tax=Maribacter sp. ACAM166 TaxID=2508996 RepID=UPI0010FF4955|nr:GNAT family protein [Maribacter sp. ACAM166]